MSDNMDVPEIDPNFAPQARARSNTWPLRPKEFTKEEESRATPTNNVEGEAVESINKDLVLGLTKAKTSSRRNAWGNLSYADLITKAIESAPEKRLTLSQIYDWMVQNIPYFKDKGDSNSSAGWKNSIRHNLSLHNRFMRMQNEGTGKSSWWVINPDAKPGKTPRRRATSMDTKTFEKKRGRVKKMVEAKRAALIETASHGSLPGSECGDAGNDLLDTFSLSPQEFRVRTSSNASSIGGRLSPIQAGVEPDLHDNQVPPMSSPIPWLAKPGAPTYTSAETGYETLTESLAEMFMNDISPDSCGMGETLANSQMSTPSPLQPQLSPTPSFPESNGSFLPAPPPYPEQHMQQSPNNGQGIVGGNLAGMGTGMSNGISTAMSNTLGDNGMGIMNNVGAGARSFSELLGDGQEDFTMPPTTMAVNQAFGARNSAFQNENSPSMRALTPQRNLLTTNPSLLRQALTNKAQLQQLQQMRLSGGGMTGQNNLIGMAAQQQQQQQQQQPQALLQQTVRPDLHPNLLNGGTMQTSASLTLMENASAPFNCMQPGLPPNNLPNDLDLNIDLVDLKSSDLECDVDQIIKLEQSFDDNLDFNFDTGQAV